MNGIDQNRIEHRTDQNRTEHNRIKQKRDENMEYYTLIE
jgi:hypothetical protein